MAVAVLGLVACATGESPVVLSNATGRALICDPVDAEMATRYDPPRRLELGPADPRVMPPGGSRALRPAEIAGATSGAPAFVCFVYLAGRDVAVLDTVLSFSYRDLAAAQETARVVHSAGAR